jgi:tRNA(fMet)-specific endonuclease VapC
LFILDTNHISILERRGTEAERLLARLSAVPVSSVHVTVISYEEQIRGWVAAIAGAKNSTSQVMLYQRLQGQLDNYCNLSVLPFDTTSATRFDALRRTHRRVSTPDLKIAAITLVNEATLLTQNERDFRAILELKVEDWTR